MNMTWFTFLYKLINRNGCCSSRKHKVPLHNVVETVSKFYSENESLTLFSLPNFDGIKVKKSPRPQK